jgi:hypothetical protein
MSFIRALQTNDTFTENGMPVHSVSGNPVVDLFFKMGGSRGMNDDELRRLFANAFGFDPALATKAAFYNRDIRGGQGERRSFRIFFRYLCEHYPEIATLNIPNVPHFGRWDDLTAAIGTEVEAAALDYWVMALWDGNKLAAKWAPREGKSQHAVADALRRFAGLSWEDYRRLLSGQTEVVENKMCEREWAAINYSHVPSVASKKYRRAFIRNDPNRYQDWVTALENGDPDVKVNARAIFPHDVLAPIIRDGYLYFGNKHLTITGHSATELRAIQAQWDALPDYMPKGRKILPVVDVSGSMSGEPMRVAVSLGLYMAERNEGPFKDAFITFSGTPKLQVLKHTDIKSRVEEVMASEWGMNTNLEAVFRLILRKARDAHLAPEEMPQAVLILSDMQFDACVRQPGDNAMQMIERQYREYGYNRPQVIFWNLRTSTGVPVKFDKQGTALVSGFSPSILRSIFDGGDMTPVGVMLRTLQAERYDRVVTHDGVGVSGTVRPRRRTVENKNLYARY